MDYRERYYNSLIKDYKHIPPESELGSKVEYKRYLKDIKTSKLEKRTSQMLNRLAEGYELDGESNCKYLIGVNDDGTIYGLDKKDIKESIKNLKKIVNNCNNNARINEYIVKKIKYNSYIIQIGIIADNPIYLYDIFD